eukprot:TRINITY_DN23259_c0_g1_i4.p1 TRINITY_DN23259_c0_g1~~TRINITY_DN23259_c0_g1_i4.p1  ORF type:complete len:341 (+),score=42.23 TRINITY_DN23259_c0_g1_i4:127-1149(+)
MPRRQPSVRSNRMQPQQADRNVNQRETNRQSRNLFRQSLLNEFMGIYGRQREGGHGRTAEAGRHADENTLSVSRRGQEQQDTHRQLQRSARHGYVPVEYFQRVPRYDLFHSQGGPESGGGGVVERLRGSEDDDANGDVVYDSEGNPCPYLSQVIQNHSPPPPLPHNPPLQPLSRDLQRSGSEGDELELLRSRFVRQIEDRYDEDRQRRREEQQWDARNQYLAYHEGRTGYSRGSYRAKGWLMEVADDVADRSVTYDAQLRACGAVQKRRSSSRRIEKSVAGQVPPSFNSVNLSSVAEPPPSTVRQPIRRTGPSRNISSMQPSSGRLGSWATTVVTSPLRR